MDGARLALIVANDEYDDPGLRRLEAPVHDASALAEVLGDPGVGAFDVRVLHNQTAQEIRTAIEDFFVDRKPDDLLLLHFSCHGVKNADGELFLALKDTKPNRLASTGLPADFVNRLMANSRSQRIALFLDCCYGGAFPRGMLVRAAGEAQIKDTFLTQEEVGGGRGRVVVTASNAMQYSFEAGELAEGSGDSVRPSVFTGALVDALSTGEADRDADGWIGMNELFTYVADKVRQLSPNQTPQMWAFGAQGDIVVARSRIRRVKPTPLEPELADAMANPLPAARYGLVDLFRERLSSSDLGAALAAHQALTSMLGDDSRKLSDAATAALADSDLKVDPPDLDLVLGDDGTANAVLTLSGPPIATAVTARADVPWLTIEYDDPRLRVRANGPSEPGTEFGTVTLTSPIGEHEVVVRATRRTASEGPPKPPPPPPKPPMVTKPPKVRQERRPLPRWLAPAGGAAAALVVALVVGFLVLRGGDGDEPPKDTPDDTKALPAADPFPIGTYLFVDQSTDTTFIKYRLPSGAIRSLPTPEGVSAIWPTLTNDGRTVIYQTAPTGDWKVTTGHSLRSIATDGSGDTALLEDEEWCPNPGRPAVGPTGLIAVACFDENGERTNSIRILDDQGKLRAEIKDTSAVGGPQWSPSGRLIVYFRESIEQFGPNTKATNLYAAPADGTGSPVQLTTGVNRDQSTIFSPDGRMAVFARFEEPGLPNTDLWLVTVTERDNNLILSAPERLDASIFGDVDADPVWTGDGRILYSAHGELMVVAPNADAEAAPAFPEVDLDAYMMFAWRG